MTELTGFLKSRRSRVRPQDVGLGHTGPRRVPGLRREELARLAGVSVDYYVRLEQGRTPNVSDQVLESVARALGLSPAETTHLKALARPHGAVPAAASSVRPALRSIVEAHSDMVAFVMGSCTEVLAWNALADEVFEFSRDDSPRRNLARYVFTRPEAATFYPDWDDVAGDFVASLHSEAARHPDDPRIAALVEELGNADSRFSRLWDRHDVHDQTYGPKRIHHPGVGMLDLSYEVLTFPSDPDLLLTLLMPGVGAHETAERLELLAARRSHAASR